MKKLILSMVAGCFVFSFAEYVAFINQNSSAYVMKGSDDSTEPEVPVPEPTPGGCDGTGIIKIKNIIEDGETWEDSAVGQSSGTLFYSSDYKSLYEISNNCWGNSVTETVGSLWIPTNKPPMKGGIQSVNNEKWNDTETLYLRFVEANEELPVLLAVWVGFQYEIYNGEPSPNPLENSQKWADYVINNKLLEYSIQVSEVPYL